MDMKQKYIEDTNKRFKGKTKELILKQIELFYDNNININKNKYNIGDLVYLKKGTFIHGIFGKLENFDYTINNGFISTDFSDKPRANKICNSVGFWNIKNNCLLRDYIINYSGFTITYSIGRGPDAITKSELIPYHKFDEVTEKINNNDDIWIYRGEQTKEVRFIPSLVSNKRQIAFILNMDSDYAKELIKADIWNKKLDDETLKPFIDNRYYPKFLEERNNRDATTTDRESAIIFGLPINLVEGILVGRIIEKDNKSLEYIKSKLPNCYICNLDGIVIK